MEYHAPECLCTECCTSYRDEEAEQDFSMWEQDFSPGERMMWLAFELEREMEL
jgi:hypothetical protein